MQQIIQRPATASGTFTIGGDLTVYRLGFGAMRLTGPGIWGPPADKQEAIAVLRRALELGVNLLDTADSYGPGDKTDNLKGTKIDHLLGLGDCQMFGLAHS